MSQPDDRATMIAPAAATGPGSLATAAAALLASQPVLPVCASETDRWVTRSSAYDVGETARQLIASIEQTGATVFKVADHTAQAGDTGFAADPVVLVPLRGRETRSQTPAGAGRRGAGLPSRVMVWNEEGRTRVAALLADEGAARPFRNGAGDRQARGEKALDRLLERMPV